ncbi:hypothetical protein BDW59DRAFT_158608 [Aspergillus cavernicola]|uniref:SnoaL-like domain-containing protein n=1 Tax=Aspergillus cavernicola TaxID=176166 RepID=A0ABR4ISP1_9EURO
MPITTQTNPNNMPDLHSLPAGTRPNHAIRNNGLTISSSSAQNSENLSRDGRATGPDACEWSNFESIFHPNAHVYTTWSGHVHHKDFIAASQAGMDKGAFIMHRCHGVTTDITPDAVRAVAKMKATITQRFKIDGVEVDAEADCRFCFFFEKVDGRWGAQLLNGYPEGYKCLAYYQELTMGGGGVEGYARAQEACWD